MTHIDQHGNAWAITRDRNGYTAVCMPLSVSGPTYGAVTRSVDDLVAA